MKKHKVIGNGKSRKGIQRFIDEEFVKILDEIKKTRIMLGKDDMDNIKADWRITLALSRHPLTQKIKDDIINSDLQ